MPDIFDKLRVRADVSNCYQIDVMLEISSSGSKFELLPPGNNCITL
jgi:hypothetical protein